MKKHQFKSLLLGIVFLAWGCQDTLDETVYSELTPGNFLNTTAGKQAVLTSAYGNIQTKAFWAFFLSPFTSGEVWNRGGSIEALLTPFSNFTWDSNHPYFNASWNSLYDAIRDANIVLDNNRDAVTEADKQINAEAKFIRAHAYSYLYGYFGPVPLYLTPELTDLNLSRASDEETKAFIEKEFLEVIPLLPVTQSQYGRATRGAAMGLLCKHYLNTRQWQKAADMAAQIMALKRYALIPKYKDVFSLANEGNAEMVWVIPANPQSGTAINALTFPTDYPLPYPNNQVFAARTYFFDTFVNSFEKGDSRLGLIVTEYTNTAGKATKLLGNDQSLSLKYEWDPNSTGATQGNDLPMIRYADILLSRAEALNELSGPSQEAIDLINMVRARAGVSLLALGSLTKDALRERILQEREWEFYSESKRREDQIRHNRFISSAKARGKNAQPFHVRFAIPLTEITANPNLQQNEGY